MGYIKRLNVDDLKVFKNDLIRFIYESKRNAAYNEACIIQDAENKYIEYSDYLSKNKAIAYGYVNDGELSGFVWAYEYPFREDKKRIYVSILHVDERFRNQHIGYLLLDSVEQTARAEGYSAVFLHTEAFNEGARRFYERFGFTDERIQLVKKLNSECIEEASVTAGGVLRLTPELIMEYKNDIAVLLYINTRAHFSREAYTIENAHERVNEIVQYVKCDRAILMGQLAEGKIVGIVWVFPHEYNYKKIYRMNACAVLDEYRNKKIAAGLLAEAGREVLKKGIYELYTWVDCANYPAYQFYKYNKMKAEAYQMVKRI